MLSLYYLMKQTKKQIKTDIIEYYNKLLVKSPANRRNLNSKCRVCLQDGVLPIQGNENTTISETLQSFDIHITEDETHPMYLCKICHEFVQSATLFKRVAKQTNEILSQNVKVEPAPHSPEHDFSDSQCETKLPEENWAEETNANTDKKDKTRYSSKTTCNICNKVINKSYYKEHVTMHDPNHKNYICDVCGMSFRLRCAYHNHSLRHRKDFPFKCQFCPYKGKYAELLKKHLRTHTGDYRYMCTECPARFLFKSNLNSHNRSKHKEPQFNCDTCKRAFHTKLSLQRHYEADHLGIKNHVCNLCGKAFGYRNAMQKHRRHVHKTEKQLFGRKPAYLEAEGRVQD